MDEVEHVGILPRFGPHEGNTPEPPVCVRGCGGSESCLSCDLFVISYEK
jgi:hypothetical protein